MVNKAISPPTTSVLSTASRPEWRFATLGEKGAHAQHKVHVIDRIQDYLGKDNMTVSNVYSYLMHLIKYLKHIVLVTSTHVIVT